MSCRVSLVEVLLKGCWWGRAIRLLGGVAGRVSLVGPDRVPIHFRGPGVRLWDVEFNKHNQNILLVASEFPVYLSSLI